MSTEQENETYIKTCFMTSTPCLATHVYAIREDPNGYLQALKVLCGDAIFANVTSAVKARVLAALHITSKHAELTEFLEHCDAPEIAKALTMLDRPRQSRQLFRKIQSIENANPKLIVAKQEEKEDETETEETNPKKRKGKRKIDLYRRKVQALEAEFQEHRNHPPESCAAAHADSAVRELIESASVSGSLARKVRNWAKTKLSSDFLEFVMLEMPKDNWQKIADLVHFSPDDFAVPYFLADIHDEEIPEDSFVACMRELVQSAEEDDELVTRKFLAMAEKFPGTYLAYSYLRTLPFLKKPDIIEHLAENIPLETVVWYFEELYETSRKCESILTERLKSENILESQSDMCKVTFYGKLLERILTFRRMGLKFSEDLLLPAADTRLKELKQTYQHIHSKVAVFGDASSSMQCAIDAATIFATMVSACFAGELSFFNHELVESPHRKPSTAQETLEVCTGVRAAGGTSLAAALWPYYKKKIAVNTMVLVTDEEENTRYNGYSFASLLRKYKKEVNANVQLIVVCVGQGLRGFRQSLAFNEIDHKTVTIDGLRPDLTKFDALLGQIAIMGGAASDEEEFVVVDADMDTTQDTSSKDGATGNSELDLVFLVDNTGSMGSWIQSAQENVQRIIRDIVAAEASDVRLALVSYRDHPPQDRSFVTQTHDFTADVSDMQRWVDEMTADGGGDAPEAVADALYDARNLSYRPDSTKVAVLIADAPPHGLGCCGDGFPTGCPRGHDPLEIVNSMAMMGITIYTVICGNFEGQAFYQGIAQLTGGQYIPISSAHLLAGVIVGGAQEEISLERLMQDAQAAVQAEEQAAGRQLDADELAEKLQGMFKARGAASKQTRFGGEALPDFEESAAHFAAAPSLSAVRARKDRAHLAHGGYGGGIDSAPGLASAKFTTEAAEGLTLAQCKRMAVKSKARNRGKGGTKKSGGF